MKLKIKYRLTAPLSHIGETASTGSYFQSVLTSSGRIPVITGNSIRGQIRDSCAMHYLRILSETDLIGVKLDKDTFNILFSGGNINGTMKDDVAKAKQVRKHFPMISLLGGGLGDMIMSGKILCGFAWPICKESTWITGIPSDESWHSMIDEIEFTRTDDSKNDKLSSFLADAAEAKTAKASTQMRYSVQYIAAGTEFVQDIIFLDNISDLELGAFYAGLFEWFKIPKLGGMAAKGFGFFKPECEGAENAENLVSDYEKFIRSEGAAHLSILSTKKVSKSGKSSNVST